MIHNRRQIELEKIWADINAGKYENAVGPIRTFPGDGFEGMALGGMGEAEVYERRVGEGWLPVPNMGDNSVDELASRPLLRSKDAYWDAARPDITAALKLQPELLSHADLVHLVRELDRRFMQLNDKVEFERKHNLVNYKPLAKSAD